MWISSAPSGAFTKQFWRTASRDEIATETRLLTSRYPLSTWTVSSTLEIPCQWGFRAYLRSPLNHQERLLVYWPVITCRSLNSLILNKTICCFPKLYTTDWHRTHKRQKLFWLAMKVSTSRHLINFSYFKSSKDHLLGWMTGSWPVKRNFSSGIHRRWLDVIRLSSGSGKDRTSFEVLTD